MDFDLFLVLEMKSVRGFCCLVIFIICLILYVCMIRWLFCWGRFFVVGWLFCWEGEWVLDWYWEEGVDL